VERDVTRETRDAQGFEIGTSGGLSIAMVVGAVSIVAAVICSLVFGVGFVFLFAGAGPALLHLISGAPKAIEVDGEKAVIRYGLRADRSIHGSELTIQRAPEELILIVGTETLSFDKGAFESGTFDRCTAALSAIARETLA